MCEKCIHPNLQKFVKIFNNGALYVGIVSRIKITHWRVRYCWTVVLIKSVPKTFNGN